MQGEQCSLVAQLPGEMVSAQDTSYLPRPGVLDCLLDAQAFMLDSKVPALLEPGHLAIIDKDTRHSG